MIHSTISKQGEELVVERSEADMATHGLREGDMIRCALQRVDPGVDAEVGDAATDRSEAWLRAITLPVRQTGAP